MVVAPGEYIILTRTLIYWSCVPDDEMEFPGDHEPFRRMGQMQACLWP